MSYKGIDVAIEVTVKEGDNSKQRGDLLEKLAKRVLFTLQYEHVKTEVRVTGCELDLVAQEKQTGKSVLVECKAYRDRSISAEVIAIMMGNLWLHDFSSGWLITTSGLGKDASGAVEQIRKSPEKAGRLHVYDAAALVDLLVSTKEIVPPDSLLLPKAVVPLANRTLLLTDIGEYWAVAVLGEKSGVADTVLAFCARSGSPITSDALIQQLAERDSNLRDLVWVAGEEKLAAISALKDAALKMELDNIAPVPVADDWSDYRPSRPKDFVGRDELLGSITRFIGEVADGDTTTRLLAIKAPSGWGKSSFLIKLRATCASPKLSEQIYLYAVDCRTASSARYPELALKKCFEEAAQEGFIDLPNGCRIVSAGQPFADETVESLLTQLRDRNRVIVLFFDQFEEITTKQELADLFVQVKAMCAAVESAGEHVVLGFSWKTDGTIPTDHPAYHVWHSFADRRREYELPLFSKADTSKLLNRLSKELSQPIEMWLRRLLAEHSQGYPWLLKKLCVHVFSVLQAQPARQRELFERALDVEALFKKDLADLDAAQYSCLEKIAKESPADSFQVTEQFGDKVVTSLMQRRLVLRNAGKLIVYWDIFRDYVLYKQVPAIPTRYIPVSTPASAKKVLDFINHTSFTHLSNLEKKLGWQRGTLDNIARDLVMMGVCQYDRKNLKIKTVHQQSRHAVAAIFKFLNSHAFLRTLIDEFGGGFKSIPLSSVEATLLASFDSEAYELTTVHVSVMRWLSWQQALGILSVDPQRAVTHNAGATPLPSFDALRIEGRARRGSFVFKGEAAPPRVLALLDEVAQGNYVPIPEDRNSLTVLRSLRLIPSTAQPVLLETPPSTKRDVWLALKVLMQPSVRAAIELLDAGEDVSVTDIGGVLARFSANALSDASKKRYGNGLSQWVEWARETISASSKNGIRFTYP